MNRSRILITVLFFAASAARLASGADRYEALYKSARAYMESGDVDRAIATLTEAIRCQPIAADAYYQRGKCLVAKGRHEDAIADYSQAIRLKPLSASFYNARSNAYIDRREYDKAVADCNTSMRLDPKFALAHVTRGNIYRIAWDYDKAIAEYSEAVRLDPGEPRAWNVRGVGYARKGMWDKAMADFTEAIRLDVRYSDAYYNRGRALAAMDKPGDAIRDYTQAIRLAPRCAQCYLWRGITYWHKGEPDRAVEDFTQTIRLDSNSADAYFQRAGVHWNRGDRVKAASDFDSCLRLSPKRFDFLENRGAFRVAGGDYQRGTTDFRDAIALDERDPAAKFESSSSKATDSAAMKFGEEQVRQMLRDRPKMAQYREKAADLYRWAARKFAGEDLGQVIHWAPSEPPDTDSESMYPTAGSAAQIRIRKTHWDGKDKGKDHSFEELWAYAVFELYNTLGGSGFQRLADQAEYGLIGKEAFAAGMVSIESRAAEKTRAFYIYRFLPWAATQRAETDPRRWYIGTRYSAREDLLLGYADRQGAYWRYYEKYFDERWPTTKMEQGSNHESQEEQGKTRGQADGKH
jgi:tetratricopeptide (TPR) repeat protein